MRLSTSMIYQQNMQGVTNAQSLWMQSGQQLSTGKRVVNPSDDPMAASQAVMVSQAQSENNQYTLARSFARNELSQETKTLEQVTSTIQSIQSIIISAKTDILSDDDRASYATQLQGLKDQLLNQANSTNGNGRYTFAAFKSDKPPFVVSATGEVTYQGGDVTIEQKVDASRSMTVGHTGTSVFMALTSNAKPEPDDAGGNPVASEANIFNTIDTVLNSLKVPLEGATDAVKEQAQADMDKGIRGMANSLNNVLSVQAEVGTQLQELDNLDSLGNDRTLSNKQRLSDLVDVDWTSAISSYVMQQAALQASYTTFTNMQGMSLFQLNK
ncbi:flagellar hook-associated protein FlgL [Yersinia massiliensis]|uniref:Flagellar hook-filament junction protein FlgL n=3 Tax=Yersinia TaxID=629 RepID=A0A0T9PFU7_9GAMM|nr:MULTISPECIES: flagellar hook-associated protein FlgL [Yersinia]HEC1648576.1 flagellar hook-associated protein FlgL [Yersinia enterocolitica]ATM86307.1 flagellar hook-filament junction protein FlgL [Yersinia frederiksenii]AVX37760.1 flagellar hook-filament junction protein FlgL [Yersinia massiliensis]MCB5317245.1 flagellar hook-associated protein FlgL [Yersinia massiliensis]MDA5546658.1 flagellar hook-associated protein FlgL [Yersinia massiliensis]